jgi:hypothetical protein
MKTLLISFIVISLVIFSCTKTGMQPPVTNSTSASETDLSLQAKSRTTLITAHTWMYKGYYFHYIDQTHKGEPQYVRGSNNNVINLDDTRIKFRKNGTFLETDGGYDYPGTWQFTDNADTAFTMTYSWGTNRNSIITLNNNKLSYKHAIGSYSHGNFAYSEFIPAQ